MHEKIKKYMNVQFSKSRLYADFKVHVCKNAKQLKHLWNLQINIFLSLEIGLLEMEMLKELPEGKCTF